MNKIKVLYDVVKTMKNKENINGIINMNVTKGETTLVSITNEFYRNNISGDTKAKINNEINICGNKIKQETLAEVNIKDNSYHKFHHEMHKHGHEHLGLKTKLSGVAFMLNTLNNLKAEEKDNKTILSLDLKEVIREGKELGDELHKNFSEKQLDENIKEHHKHHEFIKQLFCGDYKDAVLNIIVNKNSEVERIELSAAGENIINGSLSLNY